jgi:hypothetical protein
MVRITYCRFHVTYTRLYLRHNKPRSHEYCIVLIIHTKHWVVELWAKIKCNMLIEYQLQINIFRLGLGTFENLRKATVGFTMCVCLSVLPSFQPHGITWLSLDRFSRNFIFEDFSKFCQEDSRLIKI